MKARITISNRLFSGFIAMVVAVLIIGIILVSNINNNLDLAEKPIQVYMPMNIELCELDKIINESQYLTHDVVAMQGEEKEGAKDKLLKLQNNNFSTIETNSKAFTDLLTGEEKELYRNLLKDTLFPVQQAFILADKNGNAKDVKLATSDLERIFDKINQGIEQHKEHSASIIKDHNYKTLSYYKTLKTIVLYSVVIMSILILLISYSTVNGITRPVKKLIQQLKIMTKGVLPEEKLVESNDEFGDIAVSLNEYVHKMGATSSFARKIGEGNYSEEFLPMSKEDVIGNSLLDMRTNLIKAQEEYEKRAKADEIRNWSAKGLAEFADILRQNSNNMEELAKSIMINLTDYLDVNQGAIYILNQDDETRLYFEMKSAIAYGREKFMKVDFEMQEGLVGRCAFEKMPVYLREIPQEYIKVTSGLGTAEPDFLLLVPLQINEKVMGVIELASFNEIPEYQIEFVKALGENIASTISNVRINEKTNILLEESRVRGDELSAQEEELRQNMEELQATQEEAARREQEMLDTIEAINNTLGNLELDKNGLITAANDNFLDRIKFDANGLIGRSFRELFLGSSELENQFVELWSGLQVGESGSIITNFITQDGETWFKRNHF
jgi:PAS domain-containing protein